MSRHGTRVVLDNMTKTTVMKTQEVEQNAETKNERHTVERLIERVKKLEEQSKEMQQRIQRIAYNDTTTDSAGYGASSKWEDDDEDRFGWCRWRGSWWIRVDQGLNSRQRRKVSRSLQRLVTREKEGISTSNLMNHIRRAIKAEIMMKDASNAHAQRYELTSDDQDQGETETHNRDGTGMIQMNKTVIHDQALESLVHSFSARGRLGETPRTIFSVESP